MPLHVAVSKMRCIQLVWPMTPPSFLLQGLDRAMTRYKVECLGCMYSPSMRISKTSHIISTQDVCQQPSEKLIHAAR